MKILAIDTSTDYLSLAVLRDNKIAARFHRKTPMAHSKLLVPTIDKILKKAKIDLKDIDLFCISIGPGSFTGLRIGVTVIKGFAYSLGKPVVTVPTMDVIAANAKSHKGVICPVLDARKGKLYASFYESDGKNIKKMSDYLLITAKDLMEYASRFDKIYFLGDALKFIGKSEDKKIDWHPKASVAASLGAEIFARNEVVAPEDLEPFYIYSSECDITGF